MSDDEDLPTYKVLVLGSLHTGKTSLIRRFTTGIFEPEHFNTTLPNCSSKIFQTDKGKSQLAIWDTAGSEEWSAMNVSCYQGCQVVIFVSSYDEQESLKDLTTNWINLLHQHVENHEYISLFAINKSDLEESQWAISSNDIEPTAKELNAEQFIVSAKKGTNVDNLFERAHQLAEERFYVEQNVQVNTNCRCSI